MSATSESSKVYIGLVEFTYAGGQSAYRVNTRQGDYSFVPKAGDLSQIFAGAPTLDINVPELNGSLDQSDATVTIAVPAGSFLDLSSNGEPFSSIQVKVWDVFEDFQGNRESFIRFIGSVRTVTRNPNGKPGLAEFAIGHLRSEYAELRSGMRVDYSCQNTLGHGACGADLTGTLWSTGTIDAISGARINVGTFRQGYLAGPEDEYWKRGYVTLAGLSILITDWDVSDIDNMTLSVQPPASWLNSTPVFTPGCDKLLPTCQFRWFQESTFNGIGLKMQDYNPAVFDPLGGN